MKTLLERITIMTWHYTVIISDLSTGIICSYLKPCETISLELRDRENNIPCTLYKNIEQKRAKKSADSTDSNNENRLTAQRINKTDLPTIE